MYWFLLCVHLPYERRILRIDIFGHLLCFVQGTDDELTLAGGWLGPQKTASSEALDKTRGYGGGRQSGPAQVKGDQLYPCVLLHVLEVLYQEVTVRLSPFLVKIRYNKIAKNFRIKNFGGPQDHSPEILYFWPFRNPGFEGKRGPKHKEFAGSGVLGGGGGSGKGGFWRNSLCLCSGLVSEKSSRFRLASVRLLFVHTGTAWLSGSDSRFERLYNSSRRSQAQGHYPRKTSEDPADPHRTLVAPKRRDP